MLLLLLCAVIILKGQTQPYGMIDIADLKLTSCDFEKGAGAMVLFDKTEINTVNSITTVNRHQRIKIFSEKGLEAANVTIGYYSRDHFEKVSDIEAQTINLDHEAIKVTPVDKSLIYKQAADKNTKKLTFSFPAAKAGSVIEYTYKLTIDYAGAIPDWDFQGDLPVRYSELSANISNGFIYKIFPRVYDGYYKNIKEAIRGSVDDSIGIHYLWAVKNIVSFKDEPYTTCSGDNIQNIRFSLIQTPYNNIRPRIQSWSILAGLRLNYKGFDDQLNKNLKDDYNLLAEAKLLPTDEEKISFIFNKIKNIVKWTGENNWGTEDGVKKAWEMKQGNSAEINLILYNFLRMAGFKCCPTYVSTRDNGRVELEQPDMNDFNTLVLSLTTAAKKILVLDASNKFNIYNAVPFNLLNCYSLLLDPDKKNYELKILKDGVPVKKVVIVNAQIKADGKLDGSVHILSSGSNKTHNLQRYAKLGELKYKDELRNNDNNIRILSLQRENLETDTLPLTESLNFQLDLTGSDESYIYVNPTLFTSFTSNPFLSENRQAAIDFGNLNSYSIKSLYKIPAGYKVESLPKGVSMSMPDTSITFKRIDAEEGGSILVRYLIDFKRAIFTADEYPGIHDFYKKMYEMLNEQIVLKKI
ncbi:MAG: hypothetical protein JWQ54_4736 [Mucilaginibacter sp.]|nr:hypothetical protein [Mucilaginibacter sp.]